MPWRTSPEWSSPSQGEKRGFKSHPGYCNECVGRAPASPGGCNPPANAVQVQLLPDTLCDSQVVELADTRPSEGRAHRA